MEPVTTDDAPDFEALYDLPIGQGTVHGDTLYAAQLPADPETGAIVGDTLRAQADRALANLAATLAAGGSSFDDALKVTVYLTDIDGFDAFNDVYRECVSRPYPSRCVVEVSGFASDDCLLEVEVVAAV